MNIDWKQLFTEMHPGFFARPEIRRCDPDDVHSEMVLPLKTTRPLPPVPCPDTVRYAYWEGDRDALFRAVEKVIPEWVPLYRGYRGCILCGTEEDRILSFCMMEDMGTHMGLRIAGPGCVGTVPEARGRGVGLRMVQLATEILRIENHDLSYIHYTGVAPWYARLGYQTVLTWNRDGLLRSMPIEP